MTTSMPSKDALCALVAELHARGLHDLAQGLMAAIDTLYPPKPAPAPEPLPCCPCCGDPAAGEGASHPPHYWCPGCGHYWREDRRAPCPSCADEGKREIRHQRDVWRRRAEQAEAKLADWERRGAAWDEEHAQLVQGKAKATAERDEARELLDHAKGDERRAVERMKAAEDHAAIVETQLTAARADCDHWRRRCEEAASELRGVFDPAPWSVKQALAKLEGRPC